MNETKISFELAKLLKTKNYPQNEFNTNWYNRAGNLNGIVNLDENNNQIHYSFDEYQPKCSIKVPMDVYIECCTHHYSAPTQALVQKWLREKHDINVIVIPKYFVVILDNQSIVDIDEGDATIDDYTIDEIFDTYENALEFGLLNAIKLIK
jgi:hypothetical protein